ncbi:MAG: hypothetical protein ACQEP1_06205 [Nanobdellota archaeon]
MGGEIRQLNPFLPEYKGMGKKGYLSRGSIGDLISYFNTDEKTYKKALQNPDREGKKKDHSRIYRSIDDTFGLDSRNKKDEKPYMKVVRPGYKKEKYSDKKYSNKKSTPKRFAEKTKMPSSLYSLLNSQDPYTERLRKFKENMSGPVKKTLGENNKIINMFGPAAHALAHTYSRKDGNKSYLLNRKDKEKKGYQKENTNLKKLRVGNAAKLYLPESKIKTLKNDPLKYKPMYNQLKNVGNNIGYASKKAA